MILHPAHIHGETRRSGFTGKRSILPMLILAMIVGPFAHCTKSFPEENYFDLLLLYSLLNQPATQPAAGTYGLTISTSVVATSENAAAPSATLTISLTSGPVADVVVPVSSGNTLEGDVSPDDANFGPFSLTFTPANWDAPQTLYVRGVPDGIAESAVYTSFPIVLGVIVSADSGYAGVDPPDLIGLNLDIDSAAIPGITIVPSSGLITSESGSTDQFAIVLNKPPLADVSLNSITSSNTFEITANPASLTFTPIDWNAPQIITLTGIDDLVVDGAIAVTIALGATFSTDTAYNGLPAGNIIAHNLDNDNPSFNLLALNSSGLYTNEIGTTAQFQVVLNDQPLQNVTFGSITSTDMTEGAVSPGSITFTPSDWNYPKTITVTGVADGDAADVVYFVDFGASTSADLRFNGVTPAQIAVTNYNNWMPSYTWSSAAGAFASISGSGTPIAFAPTGGFPVADEGYADIPIGFSFTYLGLSHTTIRIFTNGLASLDTVGLPPSNTITNQLAAMAPPNLILAPWWDDLDINAGQAYSQTTGAAPNRTLTVEWNGVSLFSTLADKYTFQLRLQETTNVIDFVYGPKTIVDGTQTSASAGIDNELGGADNSFIEALNGNRVFAAINNSIPDASFPASGTKISFTP